MKKELNIDGNIYRLVEEKKLAFKVGKWYTNCNFPKGTHTALYVGNRKGVGFNIRNGWIGEMPVYSPEIWSPANMEEVKKLLIKEAEKRGFKKGAVCNCAEMGDRETLLSSSYEVTDECLRVLCNEEREEYVVLFDFETGKWAEIKNEPLYTNSYGTSFYKGDKGYDVEKDSNMTIRCDNFTVDIMVDMDIVLSETESHSEIMTKRECHRYIDENWDELNK